MTASAQIRIAGSPTTRLLPTAPLGARGWERPARADDDPDAAALGSDDPVAALFGPEDRSFWADVDRRSGRVRHIIGWWAAARP